MNISIRELKREDASMISYEFAMQGWDKPVSQFLTYFSEQSLKKRKVLIAEFQGQILGYLTILPCSKIGAFKDKNVPEITDFNVLIRYQNMGVGTKLMDYAEEYVKRFSDEICLNVGLHSGFGKLQKFYAKRGYIPDGSGLWYDDNIIGDQETAIVDDKLVLYLYKELKKIIR